MSLLHAELSASIDEFSATMTESVRSMTALSDDTVAELERRLAEQGHGVGDALAELHARADALGRGLDEVGLELGAVEDASAGLRADLERIGDRACSGWRTDCRADRARDRRPQGPAARAGPRGSRARRRSSIRRCKAAATR